MKNNSESFVRRMLRDQRGQVMPWVIFGMIGMLSMAGVSIDVGKAYAVRNQLQSAVNAAALAGAAEVYNSSALNDASKVANDYLTANNTTGLTPVSGYPQVTPVCLNMLMPKTSPCVTSGSNQTPANALRVKAAVLVPTTILAVAGIKNLTVGATAVASMQGVAQLWNVAIILDSTGSMGNKDSYCTTANTTAEQCAMSGIQTMLGGINPCATGVTGCKATDATANFRVSLFAFPNVPSGTGTGTVEDDYKCTGTPIASVYSLPAKPDSVSTPGYVAGTAYTPFAYTGTTPYTATYQITPQSADPNNIDANGFTSDYFVSLNTLNPASILVKLIGNGSTDGCLKPPSTSTRTKSLATLAGWSTSGNGPYSWPDTNYMTSFAGAIYAAQTALQAEQAATAALGITTKNAIIFVSDGQANMRYDGFPQKTSTAGSGGDSVTSAATTKYSSSAANLTGTKSTWGQYPDSNAGCQQAIMAAEYAKNAGTRFYAVAYGSEANGCVTDDGTYGSAQVVVTGTLNIPITSASQVIPCTVMEDMASAGATANDPWYFYTDGSSAANGCTDPTHTSIGLGSIFTAIQSTFTHQKMLPNNAS
ncbi:MAG: pilus assembly protein TadG-related protein [Terracidiphilus sp.]|jgi:Flp pilus assembly protein TadG